LLEANSLQLLLVILSGRSSRHWAHLIMAQKCQPSTNFPINVLQSAKKLPVIVFLPRVCSLSLIILLVAVT
jgi:hypothetical protein